MNVIKCYLSLNSFRFQIYQLNVSRDNAINIHLKSYCEIAISIVQSRFRSILILNKSKRGKHYTDIIQIYY